MYRPAHTRPADPAPLHALMAEHPLALLVVPNGDDALPSADLVPLLHEPDGSPHGVLRGHVSRANPLWRHGDGREVMAVFQGPQAYVSAGWFASKAEHGRVVPTWNYTVVQARGTLRVVDDPAWLHALLDRLTRRHEAAQSAPWSIHDAPADFIAQLGRAIVGFEIPIAGLDGKWKTNRDDSDADRAGVARGLVSTGREEALAMARLVDPSPPG